MQLEAVTPILNVASLQESFVWFAQLGWEKLWDWGDPPDFGAVRNGKVEIFLCQNGQGGRGGAPPAPWENTGGTWMSWWVSGPEAVDAVHALALERGVAVTWPPTDMPWGVRECHLLHPDGHTFRVSAGTGEH